VLGFHLEPMRAHRREALRHSADALLAWLGDGRLRIPVAEVLPLERAADAHRRLESRQVLGKLLLSVGDAEGGEVAGDGS